jgi:hypothetical protein
MINTTDRPIILEDFAKLEKSIVGALNWTSKVLNQILSKNGPRSNGKNANGINAFEVFVGKTLDHQRKYDEHFIQSAFDLISSDSQNRSAKEPMKAISHYVGSNKISATGFAIIKRGLKISLVELWRKGALILPSKFTPGPHFEYDLFNHEILKWLLTFDPNSAGEKNKTDTRRLYYFGPRLLMTTTWSKLENVDINEISELHDAWMDFHKGKYPYTLSCSQFPWTQLPAHILKFEPTRASFTENDLIRYSAWSLQERKVKFKEFQINFKPDRKAVTPRPPPLPGHISYTRVAKPNLAGEVKNVADHEALLSMFKKLGQRTAEMNWRDRVPTYPGREHVDVESLSRNWLPVIRAWLHYRKNVQGYRSEKDVVSALNALVDYLFLYLPWWKELYPEARASIPTAPKDFSRFIYVSRQQAETPDLMPATLLQTISIRREKNETRNLIVRPLALFFGFIESFYADDESIFGDNFRNPIDLKFDMKRGKRKSNKTNKIVIPTHIYGYMLFYLYAVEQFGQHLLERCLNGDFQENWLQIRAIRVFETKQFGFTPILSYRESSFPVTEIPNVYTWTQRCLLHEGKERVVRVPHMSALRMCIVALEMGQRFQSIQWLDREKWDSLNSNSIETYIYTLLINTDKTKVEPWPVPMVFRVRNTMRREQSFQKLFSDYDSSPDVFYEGIEETPFAKIRPLFRSATSANPVLDQTYSDTWTMLQVNFEFFYRSSIGENHIQLFYLKRVKSADNHIVIREVGRHNDPYCPISIRSIHTPHACRSTFITNRQGAGLLELSDCAALVGHEGLHTTAHYTNFSATQLEEQLRRTDVTLFSDYKIFETGPDSGYIRADKTDSSLVQNFSKNRESTISNFGFMPSMSLWTIEDLKADEHDGLELLKSGPMSHIRFRETHICPVGEECPADIVQLIGAVRRCGICPLAVKCVDHLPAIAAKKNQLLERIKYQHQNYKQQKAAGEPVPTLDAIWVELQLDINEFLGWNFSEETLNNILIKSHQEGSDEVIFHTERPDIVRRHLQLVTHQSNKIEFLLQRIAESNAFPSMTSPQVQISAAALRRKLLAGQNLERVAEVQGSTDDVRDTAENA